MSGFVAGCVGALVLDSFVVGVGCAVAAGRRVASCGRIKAELYEIGFSTTVALGCGVAKGRAGRSAGSNEFTANAGATRTVAMSNALRKT